MQTPPAPRLVLGCDTITRSSSYTANIRTRLHIWSQDRWLELLPPTPHPSNTHSTHPQAARHSGIASQNRRRCIKLSEQGRFGLAAKALTSLGLATTSNIVVESLHNKHPPSEPPPPSTPGTPQYPLDKQKGASEGHQLLPIRLSSRLLWPQGTASERCLLFIKEPSTARAVPLPVG